MCRALKLFQRRPGRCEVVIQKLSKSRILRYRHTAISQYRDIAIWRYFSHSAISRQYHGAARWLRIQVFIQSFIHDIRSRVHSFRVNRLNVYRHFFFTVFYSFETECMHTFYSLIELHTQCVRTFYTRFSKNWEPVISVCP